MKSAYLAVITLMTIALVSTALAAPQISTDVPATQAAAPRLVKFSGVLKNPDGLPRAGTSPVTFSLYASVEGTNSLWCENQVVEADEQGHYAVFLGASTKEGLPLELFSTGQAQWLGVQVPGQEEQARVLLVAVPYALKAADADTVGGKSVSSFVLYEDLPKAVQKYGSATVLGVPEVGASIVGVLGGGAASSSAFGAEKSLRLPSGGGTSKPFGLEGGPPYFNTYYGDSAGASLTTGVQNSFFGAQSGESNTTGGRNSFFGSSAGFSNTTGLDNSFFGLSAGKSNTTGGRNSFFGNYAGFKNTTGYANSFFGYYAGVQNTTGEFNTFVGNYAGVENTTGVFNTFVGYSAGYINITGYANAFFGDNTGWSNTTGYANSFFGSTAGYSNIAGNYNSFFGDYAGFNNTTANNNSFFGNFAGVNNTTGGGNSFFGDGAGSNNTTGTYNSFFGDISGYSNTLENNNSFFGYGSDGAAGITNATALGFQSKVTQSNSLVLGSINGVNGAMADTNVGIGTTAPSAKLDVIGTIRSYTPNENTANLTFKNDAAPSSWQLSSYNVGDLRITEAGIGPRMVITPTTGNVGIGTVYPAAKLEVNGSIRANPTDETTAGFWLANQSAPSAWQMATYNSGNLYINEAGVATRMVIASSTGNVGIGTADPQYKLHVAGNVYSTGSYLGSDLRLKKNISDLRYGLYEILQLRPVSYLWKDQTDSKLNFGLIAQEVEPIFPELVERAKDENGMMSLNYVGLIPILIRAMQQEHGKIETQQTGLQYQQTTTGELQAGLAKQQIALEEQKAALEQKDAEIKTLKSQNAALDARLTSLEQLLEQLLKQSIRQEK